MKTYTKAQARKLYEGKFFYEVVKTKSYTTAGLNKIQLVGPLDNVYYANPVKNSKGKPSTTEYKFLQVIDGKPVAAFKENEILVTTHIL